MSRSSSVTRHVTQSTGWSPIGRQRTSGWISWRTCKDGAPPAATEGFKAVVSYLTAHFGKPIKINEAGSADLDGTLDLGPGQADAIVTYRGAHGAFADWNALLKVPGLDAASLEPQRANILF